MFAISIIVFFVVLSESRVGLLSVFVSCLIFIKRKLKFFIVVIAVLLLAMLTLLKMDSTRGRGIIIISSVAMLDTPQNVLFGRGLDGFRNTYMIYQAKVLKNMDEEQKQLADNIKHPLNEWLEVLINYGLVRFVCMIVFVYLLLYYATVSALTKSLVLVILTFSFFSYPFNYPLTWIISAGIVAELKLKRYNEKMHGEMNSGLLSVIISLLALCISFYAYSKIKWEREWKKCNDVYHFGCSNDILDSYNSLSNSIYAVQDFHYNYAAVLLENNKPALALDVISQCRIRDYYVELLKGKIYKELGAYTSALSHLTMASAMCPNRFLPLYEKYQIYDIQKKEKLNRILGEYILNKKVKIPSLQIYEIKEYVKLNKKKNGK